MELLIDIAEPAIQAYTPKHKSAVTFLEKQPGWIQHCSTDKQIFEA